MSIADPRLGLARERGDHYLTAGHYGVAAWDKHVDLYTARTAMAAQKSA
ncbi:hypothetical protein [Achromobacter xylosoxidans]|nr:hypothetical protein [Achromobacter xylosoxidans]